MPSELIQSIDIEYYVYTMYVLDIYLSFSSIRWNITQSHRLVELAETPDYLVVVEKKMA